MMMLLLEIIKEKSDDNDKKNLELNDQTNILDKIIRNWLKNPKKMMKSPR